LLRKIQDASRSISGAVAGEASSSSTRFQSTNLISPHLHYLPFASGFPLPHFTICLSFSSLPLHQFAVFFRLSFSFAVFLLEPFLYGYYGQFFPYCTFSGERSSQFSAKGRGEFERCLV
jgi:hypothetical protein